MLIKRWNKEFDDDNAWSEVDFNVKPCCKKVK